MKKTQFICDSDTIVKFPDININNNVSWQIKTTVENIAKMFGSTQLSQHFLIDGYDCCIDITIAEDINHLGMEKKGEK